MTRTESPGGWLRRHWFLPLLPLILAFEIAFARATNWSQDGIAELAILFDLCLFIPFLFLLCYRRELARKPLLLRAAALALAGVFVASQLVPAEAQSVLREMTWVRYAGLAALALLELWVVVLTIGLVFGGATTERISEQSGVPLWVARLMQLEARFWKAVWRFLSGRR